MPAFNRMPEQPNPLLVVASRAALGILYALRRVAGMVWPSLRAFAVTVGRGTLRFLLLPPYRLATVLGLRTRRLMMPARGLMLVLFTNRYLLHVVVVSIAVATVGINVTGRQANAQDAGTGSLLYAMVTGETSRIVEEDARADLLVEDSHYAGPSSLLALPDIDFDYGDITDAPVTAISVPGTIVAGPTPHAPDEPGVSTAPRTKTEEYVVQGGDTISGIAHRFGINVGTILWANARTEFQYLRPGDVLKIPPTSGVLVTTKSGDTLLSLANRYGSAVDEIVRVNRLSPDEALPIGVELTLPGGTPPAVPRYVARDPVPSRPGVIPTGGTRPSAADVSGAPSDKLLWPTSGHVITQYYGWRHTGVDIDGDYSSPIYASHDGTVTEAGWNSGGYGIQIVVQGSGGVMTRYAHASKLFVKDGDAVKKGDVIAMVGTTGRSTGTHIHYEVYIGGKRVNPLAYIR